IECGLYNTKGHDVVGCEDRCDIRVRVEQLLCQLRTSGKIKFPVAYDRMNRILSGLQGAQETARTVAQIAVLLRSRKVGDFTVPEIEQVSGSDGASRLVVGADRGES